jgi:hypothetical protein
MSRFSFFLSLSCAETQEEAEEALKILEVVGAKLSVKYEKNNFFFFCLRTPSL